MSKSQLPYTEPDSGKFECPECHKEGMCAAIKDGCVDALGATLDCQHCGALLVIRPVIFPFHKWLNSTEPLWPADGKGTGYVTT